VQDASQPKSQVLSSSELIGWKHGAIALGLQQQKGQGASQFKSHVLFCVELSSWKHGAIALDLQQQKGQGASQFKSNSESMVGSMVPSPWVCSNKRCRMQVISSPILNRWLEAP